MRIKIVYHTRSKMRNKVMYHDRLAAAREIRLADKGILKTGGASGV